MFSEIMAFVSIPSKDCSIERDSEVPRGVILALLYGRSISEIGSGWLSRENDEVGLPTIFSMASRT